MKSEQLNKLMEKLHRERAIDFRGYKPSSLERRVTRRLEATGCEDIEAYTKFLSRRPDEYAKLIDSILINVTQFFRDQEAWDVVRDIVLPQILAQKQPGNQIRMWSAGCATGEEAYSLAILLSELLGSRIADYDVRIYATDIDDQALNVARRGEYSDDAVKALPPEWLEKYFTKNGQWVVKRELRRMLIFGVHNLVTDAPISHVDLLACRNVLIYMSVELQTRILGKFQYGLEPRGFMFLGKAESLLAASRIFSPVNERWRIFRKESPIGVTGRALVDQQILGQATDLSATEYQMISAFNEGVLRHAPTGIIAVDAKNIVRVVNPAAESIWGIRGLELLGQSIMEANLPPSLQEIVPRVAQSRTQRNENRIAEMDVSGERGRPFHISVTVDPMLDVRGTVVGATIVAENVTSQVRLRSELESLNEQLQATNEELETTNEELQSTNEELETTNEELQATNEELETTNEELQSTNEELSTTNDELSVRTYDLNLISLYYESVVENLDLPLIVLNGENNVTTWNPAAERFYGVRADDAINHSFFDLPLTAKLPRCRERLRRVQQSRQTFRSRPFGYTTRTGEQERIQWELRPLLDPQGSYEGCLLVVFAEGMRQIAPAAHT